VTVVSRYSPELAAALMRGKLDLAFLRPEPNVTDLTYRTVTREPLVAVLPSDHRMAAKKSIAPRDLRSEKFINVSGTAPVLRAVIDDYLRQSGLELTPAHEVDNLAMAMSLVASTRGVALLPAYARNFLPWSVISLPLAGEAPTIDLVIGYSNSNRSPVLKLFLARVDELIERFASKSRAATHGT
jgi:LysR family transcriptional regulator, hca operon transcriptional activator